jgi:hypothetical protein
MLKDVFSRGLNRVWRRGRIAVSGAALLAALLLSSDTPVTGATDVRLVAVPVVASAPTATPTPAPAVLPTPGPTPDETATPMPTAAADLTAAAPARRVAPLGASGIARISAPGVGLDHYIEVVGVVDGQMQSPIDGVYAVGWYPAFSAPGQPGNAVFSAHETWNHQRGPFYSLRNAAAGTEITIQMTDGRSFRFQVMTNRRYDLDDMPMAEILWPSARGAGEAWITLITCGGRIVYDSTGFGEYLDRDVVVARLVT